MRRAPKFIQNKKIFPLLNKASRETLLLRCQHANYTPVDLAGTKIKFAHKKSKRGKARDQVSQLYKSPKL